MRLRRAAVVVAVAAGTALAVTGTTNASTESECGETGTYTEARSWTDADCGYRFARSGSEEPSGHKHHGEHHKDKHHGEHHKDKHHGEHHKGGHHHKDGHHKDHHHKKQVHKKPHGGVETGDGSLAALL